MQTKIVFFLLLFDEKRQGLLSRKTMAQDYRLAIVPFPSAAVFYCDAAKLISVFLSSIDRQLSLDLHYTFPSAGSAGWCTDTTLFRLSLHTKIN